MGSGLPGIAGILLIVAAGGGFKQMLVDAGVGGVIADWAQGSGISTLVLGWLVAVGVRLATGSATVATITAAGIVSGIAAATCPTNEVSLLVLAIGCGSVSSATSTTPDSGWSRSTSASRSDRPSSPGR